MVGLACFAALQRQDLSGAWLAEDFAVLCANCHRMIHRSDDPSNLSLFKKNLAAIKA
jgi:predicted HNH restriction endonuclease